MGPASPPTDVHDVDDQRDARPSGWALGRVLGVRLYLRPSTLVTAALLWLAIYAQLIPPATALSVSGVVALASLTTVGFFVSIVGHELAHAVLARALGLPVQGVTIFYLGGITQLDREPDDPMDELAIALAGPLTNLTVGAALLALAAGLDGAAAALTVGFLGEINVAIGVFNLVPGHPLDGGTMLRAGIWRATGDRLRAARVTARLGQGLAYGLIGIGVSGLFRADGDDAVGLVWFALVGLFVLTAARTGLIQTEVRQRLDGVTVADVVRTSTWTGDIGWTVARVVADVVRTQAHGIVVDTGGRPVGAFGPDELAGIPSGVWDHLTLGETMRELRGSVDRLLPLAEVLPQFRGDPDAVLAVTDAGQPVGVVTAQDVITRAQRPGRG